MLAHICILAGLALAVARASDADPDPDCTVNVPGYTHNGSCDLLCRPASWADGIVFCLVNYIAHAATVVTRPGQSTLVSIMKVIGALLFPGSGIARGLHAIRSLATLSPTDMQKAAKAGALCMVVQCKTAKAPSPPPSTRIQSRTEAGTNLEIQNLPPPARSSPPLEPKDGRSPRSLHMRRAGC